VSELESIHVGMSVQLYILHASYMQATCKLHVSMNSHVCMYAMYAFRTSMKAFLDVVSYR
jgi:hypothetical protein